MIETRKINGFEILETEKEQTINILNNHEIEGDLTLGAVVQILGAFFDDDHVIIPSGSKVDLTINVRGEL